MFKRIIKEAPEQYGDKDEQLNRAKRFLIDIGNLEDEAAEISASIHWIGTNLAEAKAQEEAAEKRHKLIKASVWLDYRESNIQFREKAPTQGDLEAMVERDEAVVRAHREMIEAKRISGYWKAEMDAAQSKREMIKMFKKELDRQFDMKGEES